MSELLTSRRMLSGLMAAQAPSAFLFHRALARPEEAQSESLSRSRLKL